MSDATPSRPLPELRNAGAEYWHAAARGELRVPRCTACRETFWPPRPHCPHCGASAMEWIASAGQGEIHTFTVVRQSGDPYFKTRIPYVVAMIVLDEGTRLMSEVVEVDVATLRIGMRVGVTFEAAASGIGIPLFRPVKA